MALPVTTRPMASQPATATTPPAKPDRFRLAAQLLREAKAYREAPRHWRGETILRDAVAEQFRGPWGGVRM